MNKVLRVLGTIILCAGLLVTVLLAMNLGFDYRYSFMKEMNIPRFFGILAGGLFASTVSSCWFFFCANVLEKLDKLISLQEDKKE